MSRLGRNPFAKVEKKVKNDGVETFADFDLPPRFAVKMPLSLSEKVARFFHVDLPAESFILGLKAALLLRSVWD